MNKKVLKKLQLTEIEILDEIVRICDKNNIKYFIIYGTLLGAVRHKGFIPWDDDIDIAMLREDYDKFIEIASKELNGKYVIINNKNNKNYYLSFAKVYNKNTIYIENNAKNYKENIGIWVDIFPFDFINKYTIFIKIKRNIIRKVSSIISYKTLNLKKKNFLFNLFVSLFKLIPNSILFNIIKILIGKNYNNKDFIICYSDYEKGDIDVFETEDVFPLKKLIFNEKDYNAPKNAEKILSLLYGDDFMTYPPVEKRKSHNPIRIKFEDGTEEINKVN